MAKEDYSDLGDDDQDESYVNMLMDELHAVVLVPNSTSEDYVAGFAASNIGHNETCKTCIESCIVQKGDQIQGATYFNQLQRGGLIEPTQVVKSIMMVCCCVFDHIQAAPHLKIVFNDTKKICNQKRTLTELVLRKIKLDNVLDLEAVCHDCKSSKFRLYAGIISKMLNTLMKGERIKTSNRLQLASNKAKRKETVFNVSSGAWETLNKNKKRKTQKENIDPVVPKKKKVTKQKEKEHTEVQLPRRVTRSTNQRI